MNQVTSAQQVAAQVTRAAVSGDVADLPNVSIDVLRNQVSCALGTRYRRSMIDALHTAAKHGSFAVLGRLLVCFPPDSCPAVDVLMEAVGQHRVFMVREARSFVLNHASLMQPPEPTLAVSNALRTAWAPLVFAAQAGVSTSWRM